MITNATKAASKCACKSFLMLFLLVRCFYPGSSKYLSFSYIPPLFSSALLLSHRVPFSYLSSASKSKCFEVGLIAMIFPSCCSYMICNTRSNTVTTSNAQNSHAKVVQRPCKRLKPHLLHKLCIERILLQILEEETRLVHNGHQTLSQRSG